MGSSFKFGGGTLFIKNADGKIVLLGKIATNATPPPNPNPPGPIEPPRPPRDRKVNLVIAALAVALGAISARADVKPCPTEPGVYVASGDGWTKLAGTYPEKIIPGHMHAGGGAGVIAVFADGESPTRVSSNLPVFCASGKASEDSIHVLSLQSRAKERRVIVAQTANWKGAYSAHQQSFDPDAVVPITATKQSDGVYTFIPQLELRRGEYVVFVSLPEELGHGRKFDPHHVVGYDFGYFPR